MVYFTSFIVFFWRYFLKKNLNGHFQSSFFLFCMKKISLKSANDKNSGLSMIISVDLLICLKYSVLVSIFLAPIETSSRLSLFIWEQVWVLYLSPFKVIFYSQMVTIPVSCLPVSTAAFNVERSSSKGVT